MNRNWTINIDNAYSSQYTGGGTTGLIDQIRGKTNFADGSWQGYQGFDFVAHIDFGEKMEAFDKTKTYAMVCRSGARSGQACMIMNSIGFEKAYNLMGGFMEWQGEKTI